ncbi:MAG: protein-glutamate O-methyltransferase CheR [Syntrophobacteraceae bacterium]|nr:protein-glutamate O-methyltransferase CheR [Syntrophobacteraceae bacterium]
MTSIKPDELKIWTKYVHSISGISLDETKGYLFETRLANLLRETGSSSYMDLHRKVTTDASNVLRRKVLDAITTGETSFFRDTSPFDLLQHKVLPDLIDRRRKTFGNGRPLPIRIWSAACSTGQEVFSIGIVIKELLGSLSGYDVRLLGTDISDRAIATASHGTFGRLELDRGMPAEKMSRYFTKEKDSWKVRDEIRALATFRTMNLLDSISFPVKHDIIFCRNVAIYFSEQDRARLFNSLAQVLAPDGYLIIGSTESLTGLCPQFEARRYLRAVYYQLRLNNGK